MIEQILEVLKELSIDQYYINESRSETAESFFVRKKLDLKRRTNLTDYRVTVYCPSERDGQKLLGSSEIQIYPGMEKEEMFATIRSAYHAASFAGNPYYELFAGTKEDFACQTGTFAGHTPEENMKVMAEALFSADTSDTVFINSAEVFASRSVRRIINSNGVDVSYEVCDVHGEYVVQCVEPNDVETYHHFSYRDADVDSLRADVEEALSMTQARAQAVRAPKAGVYPVLLSGEYMRTLFSYYLDRSASGMIYQKYSNYEIGQNVQGDAVKGDAVTIELKAIDPYSDEGIPMKDRVLMENGTLRAIHGGNRFAYYLGIEPTGFYGSIRVPIGQTPLSELKTGPYLHIVSFSDFQMDSFSGHFGGEIRLAFLCDGDTVTPVTGGSVNGNFPEIQDHMVFSKERYKTGNYEGPLAVRIEGVAVAGE